MELLTRCLVCFDNEKEYLYTGYKDTVDLTEFDNFSSFSTLSRNETLITIISEINQIEKEFFKIQENIKSNYSITADKINFDEKKLIKISVFFKGISNYAFEHAYTQKSELLAEIQTLNTKVLELKNKNISKEQTNFLKQCEENKIILEQELETIFFNSYINYLDMCINHIKKIKELVNSWFNINESNDDKTATLRLFNTFNMSFTFCDGISLPKSQLLFVLRNKKNTYLLKKLALTQNLPDELKKYNLVLLQEYECNGLIEILNVLFYQMLNSNCLIKKCSICNKYFIPSSRTDEKYCNRNSPYDKTKTCKEYGGIKAYQDNLKNNEAMGLYRRIYMQKQMRAKRYPDIPYYIRDFKEFKTQAKEWKENIKQGTATKIDYINWLKHVKGGEKSNGNDNSTEE